MTRRLVVGIAEPIIVDTFRSLNGYGGFTWGRDRPSYMRSRLDHIFVSKNLSKSLIASNVNSSPNESDHKTLYSEFEINKVLYGPGIIRANSTLFNNPEIKKSILTRLDIETSNFPLSWNPHTKLDFAKFKLREIMLNEGKKLARYNRSKLECANEEINILEREIDLLLAKNSSDDSIIKRIDSLKESLDIVKLDIDNLKNEEADKIIFRSKAKWAEKGEKSNKYFLNLLKERQKAMIIRKIISNGKIHYKQNEISKAIVNFYRNLYKKQTDIKEPDDNKLFKDLPKLNPQQKEMLDKPLTIDELKITLKTCDESAPGPDGLTYRTIDHTWEIMGPLISSSWSYSQSVGTTSPSQRSAIITLLEKKDKEKSRIENLRPISLSNCDIKLCTKALALRTNTVLPSILSVTQTGYIPGRQVNDNSRLLEEIINKYKNSNNIAYLITLDARKAFDSVDHNYLAHVLTLFDFPISYINNVRTIYSNLSSSILVNGFTSDSINIEQSVKQGDALSCALFIIAIEPLLRQINNNKKIQGLKLSSSNDENDFTLKDMSFADDITAICSNLEGIQYIINEYLNFSKYSGIKLNIEKTEILIIGKKTKDPVTFEITHNDRVIRIVDVSKVKICGITFSNNFEEAYDANIREKIYKLERQLNIWRQRNLTLQGKILIVKTFGISQLIYSLQATIIKPQELKMIEDIIFRFTWNIKSSSTRCIGKIKRDVLKAQVSKGGLAAPDIEAIDRAIKLKHIMRCLTNSHPVSILVKNELVRTNFQICKFYSHKASTSNYMQNVMDTNEKLEKLLSDDIITMSNESTGINAYYHQLIQNHTLENSTLFNQQMQNMIKRLKLKGINNLLQLHKEKENSLIPNIRLDCLLVYSKVPIAWKKLLLKSKKSHVITTLNFSHSLNKAKMIGNISQKEIYLRLTQHLGINDVTTFLNNKHEINLSNVNGVFKTLKKITSIKSLYNVQYKILHNVYPTQLHLYRWKIKSSDECNLCKVSETLKHALYDCRAAKETLSNFETIINSTLNTNIKMSFNDVLIGISNNLSYNQLPKIDKFLLDEILIIIKRAMILQRENRRTLTLVELNVEIWKHIKLRRILGKPLTNFETFFSM